uniref:Protein UXT-like protein n=1 Tax=Aegilops tauschii TaxID=37682 RepID=M8BLC7_AEGTA
MAAAEARLRQEKVKKFEDFVDRRLKPDLVNAIAQRDNLFQQQKTFLDLKKNIENLEKNGVTSMRSMVNLGSEVYMQAEVPDTRHIFVDIGLGFHVEFTWQEALQFISVREARLARQIDEYTHLIASIKAQIKMVCEDYNIRIQRRRLELDTEKQAKILEMEVEKQAKMFEIKVANAKTKAKEVALASMMTGVEIMKVDLNTVLTRKRPWFENIQADMLKFDDE